MPIHRSASGALPLAFFMAAALLVKALVPVGWMPVFENGGVTLRLCGGWTPAPAEHPEVQSHHGMAMEHGASAPAPPHEDHEEDRQGMDQPCSFAAAGSTWTSPDVSAALAPPLAGSAVLDRFPPSVTIGRGLAAPPPPSTGPPSLS